MWRLMAMKLCMKSAIGPAAGFINGVSRSGLNAVDRYPAIAEVAGEPADHPLHRRLGKRIGRTAGKRRAIGAGRADYDDASVAIHPARRLDGSVIRRPDVDIDHPVDGIGVERKRVAHDKQTRNANQDIEGATARYRGDQRVAIGAVRADCFGARLSGKRFGGLLRTRIGKGDLAVALGKAPHDRGAYSTAATEYQDILSGKVSHDLDLTYRATTTSAKKYRYDEAHALLASLASKTVETLANRTAR
jgi:hypothetical protein